MIRILKADKDTYITDKVVDGTRKHNANVGRAGTIDLFKLYGMSTSGSSPNIELSRALIHFDLQPIRDLIFSGTIDTSDSSFYCKLKLKDVYGGQTTPENFYLCVNPLSATFYEGRGKDIVLFGDSDVSNFLSSSNTSLWYTSGCNGGGGITDACDYITSSLYESKQYFTTGEEDMNVDVTEAVKAVLNSTIPDSGFRIAFSSSVETDHYTYFVKRFSSRHAYDESKRPSLYVGYNNSYIDHTQYLTFNSTNTIFLHSHKNGAYVNLVSGSQFVTGSSSLKLILSTFVSGGTYDVTVSAGQHLSTTGLYSASFTLNSSNQVFATKLLNSGSVEFTPYWVSNDQTVTFFTGSKITVWPSVITNYTLSPNKFVVNVYGMNDIYRSDEIAYVRVNVFDSSSPIVKASRTYASSHGFLPAVISEAHYSIRDANSNEYVVPFDFQRKSTQLSVDARGAFFELDTASLIKEKSYVIDIMLVVAGVKQKYMHASPVFKVSDVSQV